MMLQRKVRQENTYEKPNRPRYRSPHRNWPRYAIAFAREGAKLVVSGRHDDKGHALVAELRRLGAEAQFIKADVRHEEEVKNLVEKTVKRFGRLDIAVNNAGTEGEPGPILEQTAETYAATFETNVLKIQTK
jgi:NAD(P)-dependent dehydrogenase (short-subunit alcohol dehydrogenase family)